MKLSLLLDYNAVSRRALDAAAALEDAGLDALWVPEPYGFDAITQVGYLAARTERMQIGTGIINAYSRTPATIAMTAAGADELTGGRFLLGLGASGPQVIEGFHGIPHTRPLTRVRETIEICRAVWRREHPLEFEGREFTVPLPDGAGTGLGKPLKLINRPHRPDIPVYWAALKDRSVQEAARMADGWLPLTFFLPDGAGDIFGPALQAGLAERDPALGPLEIVASANVAIGEDLDVAALQDVARPYLALYIGGMGARERNFYNELAVRYGYAEEARTIQDHFLAGRRAEAEAAVPRDWLARSSLIGTPDAVAERVAAYRRAGVTMLCVNPVGGDPAGTIAALRRIVDA